MSYLDRLKVALEFEKQGTPLPTKPTEAPLPAEPPPSVGSVGTAPATFLNSEAATREAQTIPEPSPEDKAFFRSVIPGAVVARYAGTDAEDRKAKDPGREVRPVPDPGAVREGGAAMTTKLIQNAEDEIRALVAKVHAQDTQEDQAEALRHALAHPEEALTCYRWIVSPEYQEFQRQRRERAREQQVMFQATGTIH